MLVSETLAVASAFCVALGSMFLGELRGREPFLRLLRWQLLAAVVMTASISAVLGGWRTVGQTELYLLLGSGFFGIALGNTTYLATIYAIGPRMTALLFSLTAPFSVILGYLALGETITGAQGIGVALVMGGVGLAIGVPRKAGIVVSPAMPAIAVAAGEAPIPASTAAGLWLGVSLGVATAALQAVGMLLARPAMEAGVEPFTAMAIRTVVGAALFLLLPMTPFGARARGLPRYDALALAIGATFLGIVLGTSLLMAALHRGHVGIVSTLSSLTPVLILPMEWIRTGRPPPRAAWFGAVLAIAGIAMISAG